MKFCYACSAALIDDARFCAACGAALAVPSGPPTTSGESLGDQFTGLARNALKSTLPGVIYTVITEWNVRPSERMRGSLLRPWGDKECTVAPSGLNADVALADQAA